MIEIGLTSMKSLLPNRHCPKMARTRKLAELTPVSHLVLRPNACAPLMRISDNEQMELLGHETVCASRMLDHDDCRRGIL